MAAGGAVRRKNPDPVWEWTGTDRNGRKVKGELRAPGETAVTAALRRQQISVTRVRKQRMGAAKSVKPKDISIFTRQLATMMRAGVPLLQSFEIVGKGHDNPAVSRLLSDIKGEVESGVSLSAAFQSHPRYFDGLYCNLVAAGEKAGILEMVLDRLATYQEKSLALKGKIKSALFYPVAILTVAFVITAVIMIFVVPAFKEVFTSFGAELPAPTLFVMGVSDFFVANWYLIFGGIFACLSALVWSIRNLPSVAKAVDRALLRIPVFGPLVNKAVVARWSRTLATMFAAGVPLVEALESVAGASGNDVYYQATKKIQQMVSDGSSLTSAMLAADVFPNMVTQLASIGEESGSLDAMLGKVADFYESEVDEAVAGISSLMEPLIMVVLGTLIGGLVVCMYLPIFKLGAVV